MTEVDTVLAGKVASEVELRLLERFWEEDMRRHPDFPRPALIGALDQWLVHRRVVGELYTPAVQRAADLAVASIDARGVPAHKCAVCEVKGWRSHGE
jgi:hypothetical protein